MNKYPHKFVLEEIIDDKGKVWEICIWYDVLDKELKNDLGQPIGKTLRQAIKEDALANSDKAGYVKYKKILLDEKIIDQNEHDNWNTPSIIRHP